VLSEQDSFNSAVTSSPDPALVRVDVPMAASGAIRHSLQDTRSNEANNFVGGRKVVGLSTVAESEFLLKKDDSLVISDDESDDTVSVSNSSDCEVSERTTTPVQPGAVEVFCGCARLTKELNEIGMEAIGVDYLGNKDKAVGNRTLMDLTTMWGQHELRKLIKVISARLVWLSVPSGSASRAREIRRNFIREMIMECLLWEMWI
jgi:hypothetical protein